MYIRSKHIINKRTGLCRIYYEIVEAINTENGSTNKILLYLGKLEITSLERKTLSYIIDRKVKGFSHEGRFSDKIEELAELISQKYKQKFGLTLPGKDDSESEEQYTVTKESLETGYHHSFGLELFCINFLSNMFISAKASNKSLTHICSDTMVKTPDGYRVQIRQIVQPEEEAKKIYSLLDIQIHKNIATQKYRL